MEASVSIAQIGVVAIGVTGSLVFGTVAVVQRPIQFWQFVLVVVFIAGLIQGAVLLRGFRRIVALIVSLLGIETGRTLPVDSTNSSGGSGFLGRRIDHLLYSLLIQLPVLSGTGFVGITAFGAYGNSIRTVDVTVTTYVALASIATLLWELAPTIMETETPRLDGISVIGLVITIVGASVVRLPDVLLFGARPAQTIIEGVLPLSERIVESLFGIPVYQFIFGAFQFVGVLAGLILSLIMYQMVREPESKHE